MAAHRLHLKAVLINWIEHPIPEAYRSKLGEYFCALDIDFTILDEHQYPTPSAASSTVTSAPATGGESLLSTANVRVSRSSQWATTSTTWLRRA